MDFFRQYSLIIGLSVLVVVLALLLSSSDIVFSSGVSFLDADLENTSKGEVYVKTKIDLGDKKHIKEFPHNIGEWVGYDRDTSEWEAKLGADVTLHRGYTTVGMYNPISFIVLQSESEYGFHPPRLCYPAHGYKIVEDEIERVEITHPDWTEEQTSISVPMEKLVLTMESDDGEVTERLVVLTFYLRGNQFTTDAITMVRIEADAPLEGSYEDVLNWEKTLVREAVPVLFDPDEEEEWNPIIAELAGWGIGGYLIIVAALSVPLAVIIYPRMKYRRKRDSTDSN